MCDAITYPVLTPMSSHPLCISYSFPVNHFRGYICIWNVHYDDVIMGTIASQITSLTSVYSTVYSGADQSKHQSSASLAFVWDRWIPRTNGQLRGKCSHSMTSSCEDFLKVHSATVNDGIWYIYHTYRLKTLETWKTLYNYASRPGLFKHRS